MNVRRGAVAALAVALLCGCGNSLESKVSGRVTLNDKPLTRGMVSFYPAQGPAAVGSIQSDGTYTISTGRGEGLHPGEYVVTVFANEPPPPDESVPGKIITPAIYNDKATSPLKFTVAAGNNVIDLPLKGDAE